MKSIAVPVNFTANSANAARYAADLALAIGADIHLLHFFQIPVSMSEVPMPENVFEDLQQSGIDLLNGLSKELIKRASDKVKVSMDMQTGPVEARLKQFCEGEKPFLVIMGATAGGFETAVTGSNSVRAVKHLPCPVLVVPENVEFHPVRKIVVACDREDLLSGMPAVLPFLRELSELAAAQLEVLHVVTEKEKSTAEVVEAYNSWKGEVKGLAPEVHFIRRPKVAEGIDDYLKGSEADLLMVFPKNHGLLEFHKSRAKQVVLHCAVPVMSVHE
jgi:nucleotide-binding universal stress UspA family protein